MREASRRHNVFSHAGHTGTATKANQAKRKQHGRRMSEKEKVMRDVLLTALKDALPSRPGAGGGAPRKRVVLTEQVTLVEAERWGAARAARGRRWVAGLRESGVAAGGACDTITEGGGRL
eukprot:2556478-Prymnesium_polylepis.2